LKVRDACLLLAELLAGARGTMPAAQHQPEVSGKIVAAVAELQIHDWDRRRVSVQAEINDWLRFHAWGCGESAQCAWGRGPDAQCHLTLTFDVRRSIREGRRPRLKIATGRFHLWGCAAGALQSQQICSGRRSIRLGEGCGPRLKIATGRFHLWGCAGGALQCKQMFGGSHCDSIRVWDLAKLS